MITDKMQASLNAQMNAEMYSSYLYLSMAAYFESQNLLGFANWMHVQAKEEWEHAMKFYKFINDRRGRVIIRQIDAPPTEWDCPLALFQDVAAHEAKVTALIDKLAEQAAQEKDHATAVFLHWFINEQVEEEANVDQVVQTLKAIKDSVGGLYQLDHQLGKRGGH